MTEQAPPPPVQPGALWTIAELGAFLKRSRRSISGDLAMGRIPCVRLPSGLPRFRPSDITLWLDLGCPSAKEFETRKVALGLTTIRSRA